MLISVPKKRMCVALCHPWSMSTRDVLGGVFGILSLGFGAMNAYAAMAFVPDSASSALSPFSQPMIRNVNARATTETQDIAPKAKYECKRKLRKCVERKNGRCIRYENKFLCWIPHPEAKRCDPTATATVKASLGLSEETKTPDTVSGVGRSVVAPKTLVESKANESNGIRSCQLVESTCKQMDGTHCAETENQLLCDEYPSGSGVTVHDPKISISYSEKTEGKLGAGCVITSERCVDNEPRDIPIENWPDHTVTATPTCWVTEKTVTCPTVENAASCQTLIDAGCTQTKPVVCEVTENGVCIRWSATYLCKKEPVTGPDISVDDETVLPGDPIVDGKACEAMTEEATKEGFDCQVESQTCVKKDPTGKLPCLTYQTTYQCHAPGGDTCGGLTQLANAGRCSATSERICDVPGDNGTCLKSHQTYVCESTVTAEVAKPATLISSETVPNYQDSTTCLPVNGSDTTALTLEANLSRERTRKQDAVTLAFEEAKNGDDHTVKGDDRLGFERFVTNERAFRTTSLRSRMGSISPSLDFLKTNISSRESAVPNGCVQTGRTCTQGEGIRFVNGKPEYRDCWAWTESYTCQTQGKDECADLANDKRCKLVSQTCPDGATTCLRPTRVYQCTKPGASGVIGEICDSQICIEGVCRPADGEPDKDFIDAIIQMEIGRQLGAYADVTNNRFFSGQHSTCKDRKGAETCCRADAVPTTSNAGFGQLLVFGVGAGIELIKWAGSPYVYDLLAWSDETSGLLTHLYGSTGTGSYSPSFSYWGATATYSGGQWAFSFSPGGFLVAAAAQFLDRYQSCDAGDQRTAMAKGQRLCHFVGTTCDKKVAGLGCVKTTEHHVCFNSRLARIINEQGRPQLGRDFGTAIRPDSRGFTIEEMEKLDFTKMDLSEFVADVVKEVAGKGGITAEQAAARAKERIEAMVKGELGITAAVPGPQKSVASPDQPTKAEGNGGPTTESAKPL